MRRFYASPSREFSYVLKRGYYQRSPTSMLLQSDVEIKRYGIPSFRRPSDLPIMLKSKELDSCPADYSAVVAEEEVRKSCKV